MVLLLRPQALYDIYRAGSMHALQFFCVLFSTVSSSMYVAATTKKWLLTYSITESTLHAASSSSKSFYIENEAVCLDVLQKKFAMESCEFEVLNEVYLQNFLHRWVVNREPNLSLDGRFDQRQRAPPPRSVAAGALRRRYPPDPILAVQSKSSGPDPI